MLESGRPMLVIVCGSRTWTDRETIRRRLNRLPLKSRILTGGARGADSIAAELAEPCGCIRETPMLADWHQFGNKAGVIRNGEMLKRKPHLVIAFRMAGESRGTDDMIRRARKHRVAVEVIEQPVRLSTPQGVVPPATGERGHTLTAERVA